MGAFETLSQALGSLEGEIRDSTRFETVGLVLPRADGRLWFELRTPNAVAVNFLKLEDTLPILRPPCSRSEQLAPLSPHLDPHRPIDKGLAIWRIDAIATAPIETAVGPGLVFGASRDSRPFSDDELVQLRAAAQPVPRRATQP